VNGEIDRRGVSIQGLPDHQECLAMRISSCANEGDVRSEGNVARDLLPDVMEIIEPKPHIFATATYCVSLLRAVKLSGAGMKYCPHILMICKDSERLGLGRCDRRSDRQYGQTREYTKMRKRRS
jgi:hypothetical protein